MTLIVRSLIFLGSLLMLNKCFLLGGGYTLDHASRYTISPNKNWQSIPSNKSDHAYRLLSNSIVSMNSSCHRNYTAPLEVLTNHLLLGWSREVAKMYQEKKTIGNHTGLITKLIDSAHHHHVYILIFITVIEDCVFDFWLIKPDDFLESETNEFYEYIKSLSYE